MNKLPISTDIKFRYKRNIFEGEYSKFARKHFRQNELSRENGEFAVYNLGPFKICMYSVPDPFQIKDLEMNLAYEFFDIIYPAINPNYLSYFLGEGPYETDKVFLEKGDYVLDAGANLGIFTFHSAFKVGDCGHVFAVEPIPFFVKCLEESVRINCSKNISILGIALGSENKEDTINLDCENPMRSGEFKKSSQSIKAKYAKLDFLVFNEKRISKLDFLKMDIEGSERNALLGAKESIFEFKPKLSICTYHLRDDPVILRDIIKSINPKYKIMFGKKKLYAKI